MSCTPEHHIEAEKQIYRIAYQHGRSTGQLEGHRYGYDHGYLTGFTDGQHSAATYKTGEAHGYVNGYIDRISDETAQHSIKEAA